MTTTDALESETPSTFFVASKIPQLDELVDLHVLRTLDIPLTADRAVA